MYSIDRMDDTENQLSVMTSVQFTSPIIEFGVIDMYQFYGGPVKLGEQNNIPPDSKFIGFTSVSHSSHNLYFFIHYLHYISEN